MSCDIVGSASKTWMLSPVTIGVSDSLIETRTANSSWLSQLSTVWEAYTVSPSVRTYSGSNKAPPSAALYHCIFSPSTDKSEIVASMQKFCSFSPVTAWILVNSTSILSVPSQEDEFTVTE